MFERRQVFHFSSGADIYLLNIYKYAPGAKNVGRNSSVREIEDRIGNMMM
jgi:hypothetical protein